MTKQNGELNGSHARNGEMKDSMVVGETSQGLEIHATLVRLTRFLAVIEIYTPGLVLRTSEVLSHFRIVVRDRAIYSGRAMVRSFINAGPTLVCEVTLDESSWMDVELPATDGGLAGLRDEYQGFIHEWEKLYKVLPEFKVVIADMQSFLTDLRLWLDQLELGIRSSPAENRADLEHKVAEQLGESIVPTFDAMHERLEMLSEGIEEDLRPVHRNFSKRQLHPLVLCSPFAHRTYQKPLGYAGDYEVVNMIARDPFEGGSLFAKIVNLWFLSQWPAQAHRNRFSYLADRLKTETLRVMRAGQRRARILNFGCGPAIETQRFLRESAVSDNAELTLVDFNAETLDHTSHVIQQVKSQFGRSTPIQLQKKSVHQVLKGAHKQVASGGQPNADYDLICCAGIFDYFSDRTCRQLVDIFYGQLAPGGALVFTTVSDQKPFRHMLEFVLEWNLIYRDAQRIAGLIPESVPEDTRRVVSDSTGVNVFTELTKPGHA